VIIARKTATMRQIEKELRADPRLPQALGQLEEEGFLRFRGGRYSFR
jgi:hypothetical protein